MTTFLGAMPGPSTDQSIGQSTQFRLNTSIEPSVLPRVMEAFAKLTIVPDAFVAERKTGERMEIDIHVGGLDRAQADHLASGLRRIIYVDSVLVSPA